MIYRDKTLAKTYIKRFAVKGITRNKEYQLGVKNEADVLYFSANPNGEAEIVSIILRAKAKLKKLKFDVDFSEFLIKNRMVRGNIICKHYVRKIELKNKGISTLDPKKIWFDNSINRLNDEGHGELLGEFAAEEKILIVSNLAFYELMSYDLSNHFPENLIILKKFNKKQVITCIYSNPNNKLFYIKRFIPKINNKKNYFIPKEEGFDLKLIFHGEHNIKLNFHKNKNKKDRNSIKIDPSEFIGIKGVDAIGKQLSRHKNKIYRYY